MNYYCALCCVLFACRKWCVYALLACVIIVLRCLNSHPLCMEWLQVDESFLKKHVSSIGNDWFDKELGFNRERLREAEELRLQQIRIEQEVILSNDIFLS